MSDEHDLELRLSRYRPAGPSPEFEARLRGSLDAGRAAVRFRFLRHVYVLAASVLIFLSLSFGVAGEFERARLRALLPVQPSVRLTEEEEAIERELGPEVLALKRQVDAAKAAARRQPGASIVDRAGWETLR